jgi:hypothetical protein
MLIPGGRDSYIGRQWSSHGGSWTETNWFTTQSCKVLAELGKGCYDHMIPELKMVMH